MRSFMFLAVAILAPFLSIASASPADYGNYGDYVNYPGGPSTTTAPPPPPTTTAPPPPPGPTTVTVTDTVTVDVYSTTFYPFPITTVTEYPTSTA